MTLEELLEDGRLERMTANPAAAERALDEAVRHADSAALVQARDPNGAYQLAYDSARKAVMAHMRRVGLRVRKGEGGHVLTATYAAIAISEELGQRLEAMRRRRNRSEYGSMFFGDDEIADAIETARALIAAVGAG